MLSPYICSFGNVLTYPHCCYPQSILMLSEISLCNYVYIAVFMGYRPHFHMPKFILSFLISSVHSRISGWGSGGNVKDLLQTGKSKCTQVKSSEKGMSETLTCSNGRLMPLDDILGLKAVDIVESCLHMSLTPGKIISPHLLCWWNKSALLKSFPVVNND